MTEGQKARLLERVARAIGLTLGYTPEEMADPENAHMWQDRLAEADAATHEIADWIGETFPVSGGPLFAGLIRDEVGRD